ncbi:hypothetical protein FIBSPDRAFT_940462 [Athelia psychrophila]|uniref:Uncharacterized protein n=1 Tax=Athelia psychrophila TaxID=1759441 RepID=A0A167VW66_9AGAM|nr:hypothetical protein FIBSPDRAFT_940462 [Fibularhizoctonia sp. CBS 109695]
MDELDEEIKRVSAELAWLRGEREEPRGPLGRLRIENWTDAIQLVIMRLVWKIYLEYLLAEISSDCCVVGNGKHRIVAGNEAEKSRADRWRGGDATGALRPIHATDHRRSTPAFLSGRTSTEYPNYGSGCAIKNRLA